MDTIIGIIILILLPPLSVFLKVGFTKHFWINLLLWIFGLYFGGLVHGIWVYSNK